MKWTRSELLKNSVHVNFDEDVTIDAHAFDGNLLIEDVMKTTDSIVSFV